MRHIFLIAVVGFATTAPPDKPTLGEWPAVQLVAPVTSRPDEPRPLSADRFRLFWVSNYTGTIPLRWQATPLDASAQIDFIDLPNGAPAIGILEGESRAKAHRPPDGVANAVAVWGLSPGRVLLTADGVEEGRIVTLVRVVIAVGGTVQPIPVPPVPIPNPPPHPVPASLYFLIVRANGPASPEFAAVLANPAWSELRKAGHIVKDKTLGELGDEYRVPTGTTLPCVVTLKRSDRGMNVVRGPVDLPSSSEAIRRLTEVLP
jgi:hypothetical protein